MSETNETEQVERIKIAIRLLDHYLMSVDEQPVPLWDIRAVLLNYPANRSKQVIERERVDREREDERIRELWKGAR